MKIELDIPSLAWYPSPVMIRIKGKRESIRWAKKRLPQLERQYGIRRSAINQLLTEAERRFNIGLARIISKALKIERNPETEEETVAWESGESE